MRFRIWSHRTFWVGHHLPQKSCMFYHARSPMSFLSQFLLLWKLLLSWHLLSSRNCLPSELFRYCSPLWYLVSFSLNSYHQNLGVTSISIFPALATVLSIRLTFPRDKEKALGSTGGVQRSSPYCPAGTHGLLKFLMLLSLSTLWNTPVRNSWKFASCLGSCLSLFQLSRMPTRIQLDLEAERNWWC